MAPSSIAEVLKQVLFCVLIFMNAAAAESADPALENNFPPRWQQVPGELEAFGKIDNLLVVYPWTYYERMGLCKTLLNYTHKYFAILGLNKTDNVLWGLPLLLEWEFASGRLADPSSKRTTRGDESGDLDCISPSSWGACMDYYLSTVPFLVAAEAGIFGNWQDQIEILPPKELANDYCYTYDSCYASLSIAMDKWTLFFKTLMASTPSSNVPSAVDQLQYYMWDAHEASIESALPKCKNGLRFVPKPEADFDNSLAKGVHFVGATRFQTNYKNMKPFMANLPPRILRVNDKCPLILDFTPIQNTACQMLTMLTDLNMLSGGSLLVLWKQAMCIPEGRKVCEALLESLFAGKTYTLLELTEKLASHAGTGACNTGP